MKKIFLPAGVCILAALSLLAGCAHPGELRMRLAEDVKVPPHRVLVFFVDGLRADTATRMMAEGRLPNMKKYLYDRGCHTNYAVSVFPSITYAAIASMMTGRYPGHHAIIGNEWFDRDSGLFRSYICAHDYQMVDGDLQSPTVFELLKDKYTVTIQTANRRGATRPFDNWMSSGIAWYFNLHLNVDRLVAQRFEEIAAEAEKTGRWPDYVFAYFPAVDHMGHAYGSASKQYENAIINVDNQVGRICRGLERNDLLDDYYLIFLSDHGHVLVDKNAYWLPGNFLTKDLGLKKEDDTTWRAPREKYQVVLNAGGPRQAIFHLRCSDQWSRTPTFDQVRHFLETCAPAAYERQGRKDLIELLTQVPAIRVVTAREDAGVAHVFAAGGEARVTRKVGRNGTKTYRYEPIRNDPLGYRQWNATAGLVNDQFYDAETWLQASAGSEFPDFVPQIVEMYDSPRAGQISVYAALGWDFDRADYGGHGSVLSGDMHVPFLVAGPGIQSGECIKTARVVDLMPTVLDMLGCRDRLKSVDPIDGRSLLPLLTAKAAPRE